MNHLLEEFNKAFDNRARLAIMSVLMTNRSVNFATLKQSLKLTDGNLATHIATLEQSGFLRVARKFSGKKPQTSYSMTAPGRKAFRKHLHVLEQFLQSTIHPGKGV